MFSFKKHFGLKKRKISSARPRAFWGIVLGLFATACLGLLPKSAHSAWEKSFPSPAAEAPTDFAACPEKSCFYAATKHQVFENNNRIWRSLFNLSALSDSIVRLYVFSSSRDLWIQTEQSIYRLNPVSGVATRIYETKDSEKFPLSFSADGETLWIGTSSGLFVSHDAGKTWQKRSDLADHYSVPLVRTTQIGFFFATEKTWQLQDENETQTVLKVFDSSESAEDSAASAAAPEDAGAGTNVFFDFLETEENFYLATLKGVFQSKNGYDWQLLSHSGLRDVRVSRILWNQKTKKLLALTRAGFFSFDPEASRWTAQNEGLAKPEVISALVTDRYLLSANSEGLWVWSDAIRASGLSPEKTALFQKLLTLEPGSREIHKQVIRYANVSKQKTKRWHAESRVAALLPNLSLGKDYGTSNNVDLDRGGTSDPDRFIGGPWNKDRGADIDLSWDLGDFIFSSNQTSIDSREKLMVDQRNDLLSEATRLFYERRRLQREIIFTIEIDENEHAEKMIRLEELTALLDALTDGYLSKQLEKIYQQNLELEELWTYSQVKS